MLAVGAAYLDINCPDFRFGPDGLRPDTELVGGGYHLAAGGSAVNFARLCGSLGLAPQLICKVGADPTGEMLTRLLHESDIRPTLIVDPTTTTNISINLVDPAGRSIMTVVGSANQSLSPVEVTARALDRLPAGGYLYLGGCFKLGRLLPAFADLAVAARKNGTRIVVDHGRLNARVTDAEVAAVRDLAMAADYYLPSRGELLDVWGAPSVTACLRALASLSTATIVVKDGTAGAATLLDDEMVRVPAFDVTPIHTIGAGDSFNAGLIAAISRAEELPAAMRFASATAALHISRPTLPTRHTVTQFLGSSR